VNGLEFSIHNFEFSSFLSHHGIIDYAEIMQSNANSRGFLDANQYKLNNMILYWNVGLLITDAPDAKNCQQQLMNAFSLITECLQYVFFLQYVFNYLDSLVDHHAYPPSLEPLGILLDKNLHAPGSSGVQIPMYCCYLVIVTCLGIRYAIWFNCTCCFVAMSKEATSYGNS
jgi:hypothetical protein